MKSTGIAILLLLQKDLVVLAESASNHRCFGLARIRAKRSGEFLIRYGATMTYRLVIGKSRNGAALF